MAGDAFSRLRNQVQIFFTVTLVKKFDSRTRDGRLRMGYCAALVLLLLFVVIFSGDTTTETEITIRANGVIGGGGGGGRLTMMDEDEDDEEEGGSGDDDDEEERDDEGEGGSGDPLALLKSEQQQRQSELKADFAKFFESYHHQEDISTFIGSFEQKYSGLGILEKSSIGKTYEKRELTMYSLGKGKSGQHVLVLGSEHGCEWSVPMYLSYVVMRLVQLYGINEEVTQVLDAVKIHVVPYMNPDGAQYTLSKGHDRRHYYKNRAPVRRTSSAKGMDLRENWHDMTHLEPKAVHELAKKLIGEKHLSAIVGVQCCTGSVTAPRNVTCVRSDALEEQATVGKLIAAEMNVAHQYTFSRHSKPSRKKSQANSDNFMIHWAQNQMGINLAFTLSASPTLPEPKKKGHHAPKLTEKKAIEVPEKDLLTGSREITKGVVALAKYLANEAPANRHLNARCRKAEGGVEQGEQGAEEEEDFAVAEEEDSSASSADHGGPSEDDEEGVEGDGDPEDDEEDDRSEDDRSDDDGDEEGSGSQAGDDDDAEEDPDSDGHSEEEQDGEEGVSSQEEQGGEDEESKSPSDGLSGDAEAGAHDEDAELSKRFARGSSRKHRSYPSETFHEGKNDMNTALRFAKLSTAEENVDLDPSSVNAPGSRHFLYFAYGPDMMYELMYAVGVTSATKVANVELHDHAFDYTYYSRKVWKSGIADIYRKRGSLVLGVLYRVDKAQKSVLDRHNLASSDDSHVQPVVVKVQDRRGTPYTAITYRVPVKIPGEDINNRYRRFKPSRQYRNCVIRGAKQQRLSEDYIEKKLRSISALFSDKIGSTTHRNFAIGNICDPL